MRTLPLAILGCLAAPGLDAASTEPRIALSDLNYVGSFRVPGGQLGSDANAHFDYSDFGVAFDPVRHGLYLKGHVYGQMVAEVSIPTPVKISDDRLSGVPTATLLQGFREITGGHLNDEGIGNGVRITGLLLSGGRLIGAVNAYYDAAGEQTLSHFTASADLGATDFHGLYRVGADDVRVRMLAGAMTQIPPSWQAALGGPVLTGYGGGNIIGGSSVGPSAWAFDPAEFGVVAPVPAKPNVFYPLDHSTLGTWGGGPTGAANPILNGCSSFAGMIFPAGTRTVLFFGATGMGKQGYGEGTDDPSLDGTTVPGSSAVYCYDPANGSKGYHAYPYSGYLWAYDANDLAEVVAGHKQPWEVVPYANGQLALPVDSGMNGVNGAAYDPATRRVYVVQDGGDHVADYSWLPLVHVYQLPDYGSGGTSGSGSTSSAGGSSGSGTTGGTAGAGGDGGSSQKRCGFSGALAAIGLALAAWRRRRGDTRPRGVWKSHSEG